jgi:hypothetical protein
MIWLNGLMIYLTGVYFALLLILIYLLSPKITRKFKYKQNYKENLYKLVLTRQILLFFLPLAIALAFFGVSFTSNQLLSLIILGLSINVFWVVQLPLLTKANLSIDFAVDQIDDFESGITLTQKTKQVVYIRIYNLGFSTLKNGTVLIYFGDQFEKSKCKIIPSDNEEYEKKDFKKRFSIQKAHAGVVFSPKENFITMPPQEWFVFPVIVEVPECELDSTLEVQFYSENSWGVTHHRAPIKTKEIKKH